MVYEIHYINEEYFDQRTEEFLSIAPTYYSLYCTTFPSLDRFKKIMFSSDPKDITLAIVDPEDRKIISVILINLFESRSASMSLYILSLKGRELDPEKFKESVYPHVKMIFNKYALNSLQSNTVGFEKNNIACLGSLGFVKEADLAEQVYFDGQYHDSMIFSLFRDTLC